MGTTNRFSPHNLCIKIKNRAYNLSISTIPTTKEPVISLFQGSLFDITKYTNPTKYFKSKFTHTSIIHPIPITKHKYPHKIKENHNFIPYPQHVEPQKLNLNSKYQTYELESVNSHFIIDKIKLISSGERNLLQISPNFCTRRER